MWLENVPKSSLSVTLFIILFKSHQTFFILLPDRAGHLANQIFLTEAKQDQQALILTKYNHLLCPPEVSTTTRLFLGTSKC